MERGRERKQKVQKAGTVIVDNSGPNREPKAKRPKKGNEGVPPNWKGGGQTAIREANSPSTEEVCQIMPQSLAEHDRFRIKELLGKTAVAEKDAISFERRNVEFEEKCVELKEESKAKDRNKSKLQMRFR